MKNAVHEKSFTILVFSLFFSENPTIFPSSGRNKKIQFVSQIDNLQSFLLLNIFFSATQYDCINKESQKWKVAEADQILNPLKEVCTYPAATG